MEKERYVVMENFGRYIFHDTLCDKYYSVLGKNNAQNLVTLLNQQDTRIKELEEENQQFKWQLKEKNKVIEMQKSIDRYDIGEMLTENVKLKQSQNKNAIEELKSVKDNLLDLSNNCWQFFIKNGEPFMTYEDVELFVKVYINNQIEELRS